MVSRNWIFLLGLLVLAAATPLSAIGERAVTVTDTDLANFNLFAQYTAATYCTTGSSGPLNCSSGACPSVAAAGAVATVEFDDAITDMTGLVAVDPTNKFIVVAFRGSHSIRSYIADILFLMSDCEFGSGCRAHSGFLASWLSVKSTVMAAVEAAQIANPTYSIVTTGHSLGAAVATLAGADLRVAGYPCDIYTFGSPRVGNDAFANFVTAQNGSEFRVTHVDDPVPRLAPILFGYRHTSPEYWLSTGTATTTDYTIANISVCEGIANVNCNAGQSGFDTTAHLYYLRPIAACGTGGLVWKKDTEIEQRYANLAMYATLDIEYATALPANGSAV